MTTYYIDPSASTNGSGSEASPYNAFPIITSNNTYLVKNNTTYTSAITVPTSVTKVAISNYGVGPLPKIIPGSSARWSVRITNAASYITIQNLDCSGAAGNGTQTTFGVYIGSSVGSGADNITIKNCFVHDIVGNSSGDCSGISGFGDNVKIQNCVIYNIPDDGVWIEGLNTEVSDCQIFSVGQDSSATGDCIQLNGKTGSSSCGAFLIARNYLNHSQNLEKQCFIVSGASAGNGGLVIDNYCEFPLDYRNSGNYCIYSDQPGTKILRNYLVGGTGGILIDAGAGQIIRGNFIYKTGIGINTANSPTALLIEHNTIVESLNNAMYLATNDSTTNVRYNIVLNNAKGIASHANIVKTKNCYYNNTAYNWAVIGAGGSIEADAITTNPNLTWEYLPKTSSNVYRAGAVGFIGVAKNGITYNNPPSIGAFEAKTTRAVR